MDQKEDRKISLSEVVGHLQAETPSILADRPVMLAYVYGSVVDDQMTPSSDVDIALVLEPGSRLSAYERTRLEFDIAAEIERRCCIQEADVRSMDNAPLTVQGKVLTEGILLYSRDEEFRVEYEVRMRKLYFDFLPVAEMMREAFFEGVRQEGLSGGKARQD